MSHPAFTLLMALLLAASMAAVETRSRRERAYVAVRVFVCCIGAVFAGGWLMYAIHG
jgi:hypothetical protein